MPLWSCFLANHSLINWLSWQQEIACLQFFVSKDTPDNYLKLDISLVKISWTVFEIFSKSPQMTILPLPSPIQIRLISSKTKGELEYRNLFGCNNDLTLQWEGGTWKIFYHPLPEFTMKKVNQCWAFYQMHWNFYQNHYWKFLSCSFVLCCYENTSLLYF